MRALTLLIASLLLSLPALVRCDFTMMQLDADPNGVLLVPRPEGFFVVDPNNGNVTRVAVNWQDGAPRGAPIAGVFSPDGARILAVVGSESGSLLSLVDRITGDANAIIHLGGRPATLAWSPNGEWITFSELYSNAVRLSIKRVVHTQDGGANTIQYENTSISPIHCWLPDSESVIVLKIGSPAQLGAVVNSAVLVRLGLDQRETVIVNAIVDSRESYLDLRPDGLTLLLSAVSVWPEGSPEPERNRSSTSVFRVELDSGKAQCILPGAAFGIWSPDGSHILYSIDPSALQIADEWGGQIVTVASNATRWIDDDTAYLPTWIGNDRITYLARNPVLGDAAKNFDLTVVRSDGTGARSLQLLIDTAAADPGAK